ncbi:hypothetical protein BBF96_13895 [Anoxybacter fermentans]|uniref:ABC transporter permease n=1 Tax=Anoxybacter fermentans TaxID=1323375 RepID=A0A3Q9HSI5_9FIRM|nr:ABC-2 family transporter protein [Anoxybacter fermentans]AZR74382.1 hypothetical protein BBF96_13895 [Anoxybacter fermentans]
MIRNFLNLFILIRVNLLNYRYYFINSFFDLISYPGYLIIYYFVWKGILNNSESYTSLRDIMIYFSIALFVYSLYNDRIINEMVEDCVVKGELTKYLCKPITLIESIFGKVFCNVIIKMPFLLLLLIYLKYLQFKIQLFQIIQFLIIINLSIIINTLFYFLISLLSFKFERVWVLRMLISNVVSFFSGSIIPLYIFPEKILKIINILPFKFFVFVPTTYLQNKLYLDSFIKDIFIEIVWLIIFAISSLLAWQKALKVYSGYGV